MVFSTKVTAECITQVQDMMAWICPDLSISGGGAQTQELNELGFESIADLDFSAEENLGQVNFEIIEDVEEKMNNNLPLITDMDASIKIKTKNLKKMMRCHMCGFRKMYIP